ncbi:ATPase [Primorskyibacter aestuariivivens]|uniref:BadF/BadG/BcrA/BcrD ATPase family protein n=1 Tax=Primorskyibacter aestuariivivens TaxID=1888912 RepID=UPI0022FFF24C|nr:BadF/BadG/BcrA/BcrD ATPase family protein [Primorskyibacter aestuariivivens]MDA7429714.1 ATPase [Primorskyibacter aestuariivivens]
MAVDGGGTRCRVAARVGGETVSVETGSANASTDFNAAIHEVTRGLEQLAARISCPVGALVKVPAFVGLAGVTGEAVADRLRAELPFQHVRIADDRVAAVRGALGPHDGVVAHCGTGSFYAAQIGGAIRLAGGWGPVLGDEASAQWVGRTALQLTLEATDGRRDASPLTMQLLAKFDGADGIIRFAGKARPPEFGAIAPLVTHHAAQGDAISCHIMREGADKITHALDCLGWHPGLAVCLTGGIGPHFRSFLSEVLRSSVADRIGEPIDGAIALALEFAQELANERS